ncbi:hypothetical protein R0135_15140 [Congregibacter variabilis]|uniref:Uncharacterized protein n=1 Tax=Congregibacter variabilis TaxID=3081200 RepID=A0ABZ0I0R2_9GAMM|nr:hypothetical protein R0135_15140 [Congregibacter sp. IMCC43200]
MQHVNEIRAIMRDFARTTGLSDNSVKPRRYLWTDAFAVCNFLELYRESGQSSYLQSARALVDQVHLILGQYSDTDPRSGWISGLDEQSAREHPTAGGLRIGKPLAERSPQQSPDDRLEWDRDGQYFHYLTRWMQALTRMAVYTGEDAYQRWALELAQTAHQSFCYTLTSDGPMRMYWKMSIDLSRPLVDSMGQHDPLDAVVSYLEINANNSAHGILASNEQLEREIAEALSMCAGARWATDDPLGIGSLLIDTFRLAQLQTNFNISPPIALARLLADCEPGLQALQRSGQLAHPAQYRLAFRELGLATGLEAINRLNALLAEHPRQQALDREAKIRLERLEHFGRLSDTIREFWLETANQQVTPWRDHQDINSVMLATSLAPDAFLFIRQRMGL